VGAGAEQNNHYLYDSLLSALHSVGRMSEMFESFSVLLIGLSDGGMSYALFSKVQSHLAAGCPIMTAFRGEGSA